jgi:molecular chaperone DnaJ
MGNIHSADDVYKFKREALKKVYAINRNGLTELRVRLRDARGSNPGLTDLLHNIELQRILVNELRQEQNKLQGRIPWDKFNLVNTFLTEVARDINTFVPGNNTVGRETSQQQQQQQQNKTSSSFENDYLRQMANDNPSKFLGLNDNYNLQELKTKYKKLALKYHPDRNSGESQDTFNLITEAYQKCLEQLKLKETDKNFHELKMGAQEYRENQEAKPMMNEEFIGRGFSVDKFNRIFSEHRTTKPEDTGYKDWLQSNENTSEEPERDPSLIGNFNSSNFNAKFNATVKPCKNEIIEYKNPRELLTGGGEQCETLGQTEIKNFSGYTKTIQYTDLREAHTKSRLVDPRTVNLDNRAKSIDEVKVNRGKKIRDYTEAEWADIQQAKLQEKQEEETRKINLQNVDEAAFQKYDKIHKLMLTNVYQ